MKSMVVLFVLFLVIGVVCLALGVNEFLHQEAWFTRALLGEGTITAYDMNVRNDGKVEFCPRIEFTTKAGEPATTYGDICPSQPDKSQIGKHESFYYDPNKPSDTRTKGWFGNEGSGLIIGVIGFVFFPFIGSLGLLGTYWQNRRAAAKAAKRQQQDGKSILEQDAERYHANQRAAEQKRKIE